ncbi:MAG: hypothetical protein QM775_28270 [Pirellulales bacterium]
MNESGAWYLRKRGQTFGPYSSQQLSQLRDRGQISRFHELSQDKYEWQTAETIGLFAPAPVRPEQSTELERPTGTHQNDLLNGSPSAINPATVRSLSLSIGMLTIAYVLELVSWILVGFIWLLGFLSDNVQLFDVAGIIILGSIIGVNIVLLIGYGIGCGTGQSQLSTALPITCLMLQIIDFLSVLFATILAVVSVIAIHHWHDAFGFNTGMVVVNGLRFILAVFAAICLVEWLRAISVWLKKQSAVNVLSPKLLNAFYYVYGFQVFLALIFTILMFSIRIRADNDWRGAIADHKLSVVLGIVVIVYAMFQCVSAVWRIVLLNITRKSISDSHVKVP